MSNFANALSAIIGGGATGLFGVGIKMAGEWMMTREKNKHEVAMAALEMESMKLEAELKLSQTKVETQAAMEVAEINAFAESYKNDKATYVDAAQRPVVQYILVGVDAIRGLIRPGITLWMGWTMVRLFNELQTVAVVDKMQATQMLNETVTVLLYVGSSCILWWFGIRTAGLNKR